MSYWRATWRQAVTLILGLFAWAFTSLVLGGDPGFAHSNIVVTVAAIMSGTVLLMMSVLAAILRWSGSDEMTLQLLWRDVAVAILQLPGLDLPAEARGAARATGGRSA